MGVFEWVDKLIIKALSGLFGGLGKTDCWVPTSKYSDSVHLVGGGGQEFVFGINTQVMMLCGCSRDRSLRITDLMN